MIIIFDNELQHKDALQLGAELALQVEPLAYLDSPEFINEPKDLLYFTEGRLEFRHKNHAMKALWVNFASDALTYRIQHGGRKKEAIARAVGLKKDRNPTVFDLTAGLGRDSYILATLGCQVHLFERNKVLFALLADGLQREKNRLESSVADQMTLHHGDAIVLLAEIAKNFPPEVIYLDPMFPDRSKSALVKKEMRLIKNLVGADLDSDALFSKAMDYARERVVCKRPRQAPPLNNKKPDMSIETKKHRFDVYFTGRRQGLQTSI